MQSPYLASYAPFKNLNETEAFQYIRLNPLPTTPISMNDFLQHSRIDVPLEQTDYLNMIIYSAIHYAEEYMSMTLLPTKWRTYRNNFDANAFELRKGYFQSLEKFQYIDLTTGLYVDVDSTIYQAVAKQYYGQILLMSDQRFPYEKIKSQDNAILIEFTSGLSSTSTIFVQHYPDLKFALLQHCAFLYENRGNDVAVNSNSGANSLPQMILDVYEKYKAVNVFGGMIFSTNVSNI
jgi:hypothetical protein